MAPAPHRDGANCDGGAAQATGLIWHDCAEPWKARSSIAVVVADRRGVAAVFLAVALVPMVGAIGLAVDSSLGYLLKTRMGKSLDTAGLAAGRVALDANAEEVAEQFFNANFGTGTARSSSRTSISSSTRPSALSPSPRRRPRPPTSCASSATAVSARTVIERETTGMELALVMDNTGSMWDSDTKTNIAGTPFEAMQNAALDLIDIIYGDEDVLDSVWVSLVPFVATVNIGTSRTGWLAAGDRVLTNPASFRPDLPGGGWKGCVMARAYPYDTDDTTPAAQPFTLFFFDKSSSDNNWPPIKRCLHRHQLGA
jgi:Flp pilus assembly protein TadG